MHKLSITVGQLGTRFAYMFSITTLALLLSKPVTLLLLLTIHVAVLALWRCKPASGRTIFFLLIIACIQLIFRRSGDPVLVVHGITVFTKGGLSEAISSSVRLYVFYSGTQLVLGVPRSRIMSLFTAWKLPREMALLLTLTVSFIEILKIKARNAYIAIQLRGINPDELGLRRKLQLLRHLLTPLFLGVLVKAHQYAIALEVRGFRSARKPTQIEPVKYGSMEVLKQISLILLIFVVLRIS